MLLVQPRLTNLRFNKANNSERNNTLKASDSKTTFGIRPAWWSELTSEGLHSETDTLFKKAVNFLKAKALDKYIVTTRGEIVSFSKNKKFKGPYFVTYKKGDETHQIGILDWHNTIFSKLSARGMKEHKYGDLNNKLQSYLKIFLGEKN